MQKCNVIIISSSPHSATAAWSTGYETAKSLLYMNAVVILACRSIDKANDAKKRLLEGVGCSPTKVIVLKLDLCGFDSVRKFVKVSSNLNAETATTSQPSRHYYCYCIVSIKEFRALGLPLHCLINNAGVMMEGRNLTQVLSIQLLNTRSLHWHMSFWFWF